MIIGYARTSTLDQTAGFEAQKRDLEAAGIEKLFRNRSHPSPSASNWRPPLPSPATAMCSL